MEENKQIQAADSTAVDAAVDAHKAGQQLKQMMEYARNWLKAGEDYARIAGSKKPSLLKSGAEKMNLLMGLRPSYQIISEVKKPEDSYYYVQVKCELRDRKGDLIADCIGSCNNKEKAKKNMEYYDSFNPVLKVSEKRAFVGATLHANALSQMYSQQEDLDDEDVSVTEKEEAKLVCDSCKVDVSEKVAKYSAENFGKILCIKCQKST